MQSYLHASAFDTIARFYGELDIKTLGGAGFASQRTTDDDRIWDLSGYDGIELRVVSADGKRIGIFPSLPSSSVDRSFLRPFDHSSFAYFFLALKLYDPVVSRRRTQDKLGFIRRHMYEERRDDWLMVKDREAIHVHD